VLEKMITLPATKISSPPKKKGGGGIICREGVFGDFHLREGNIGSQTLAEEDHLQDSKMSARN
jgi:hypothetical protein